MKKISIIVPCYNEQEAIPFFYEESLPSLFDYMPNSDIILGIDIDNATVFNLYGGNNLSGSINGNVNITTTLTTPQDPLQTINIDNLYGGGNEALGTYNSSIIINYGHINNLYGGGKNASINNSEIFKEIVNEYGSFYNYLKTFTHDKIIYEIDKTINELSDTISNDLQKRGMKFVGSTIIYSYLQAIGIIYSHEKECYLYKLAKYNNTI